MQEAEFRDWLIAEGYGQGTVSTQLARTRRIDQAYGDLDQLLRKDRFEGLRRDLSYSSNDKRSEKANPSRLQIDGDLYSNLASYRASLNFYERFASPTDSDGSEGDRPDREAVLKAIDEFETIGRDAFMILHEFADRNITYQVAHNETLYPSKAIFGVAHKYMPGGAARNSRTCNGTEARLHLEKLGFKIVAEDNATEGLESAGQRDADKIRQYVLDEYIQPGFAAEKASVDVLVRDVNSALNLNQAWPNICQALGGRKFRQMTGLGEPDRIGADMSSAKQLKGAERWINEFPDRLFLDKLCEVPLPLAFPPAERRKVHRIIVARGAEEAGRKHFQGGLGTFVIRPSIKGPDHFNRDAASFEPFAIGDIDPSNHFVHVFDPVSLDIVMQELDTISDFTEYLDKRAAFIRSGKLSGAHGEEDLLAYYAVRINEEGDHDFRAPEGCSWDEVEAVTIGSGHWTSYIRHPQYLAKKAADKISYAWDGLIETFTKHLLGGTSIVLPGHTYSLTNSEVAVRYMALQNRYIRRSHSEAIRGALKNGRDHDVFFRAMISPKRN